MIANENRKKNIVRTKLQFEIGSKRVRFSSIVQGNIVYLHSLGLFSIFSTRRLIKNKKAIFYALCYISFS